MSDLTLRIPCCVSLLEIALAALQAPSGSPPDVSSRLLELCNVVEACEDLSAETVIEAAHKMMYPGSSGEHWMLPNSCWDSSVELCECL